MTALDTHPLPGDVVLDLNGAFVFPGLVNAHDHLELNNFPRLKWRDRYANTREWVADFQPRFLTDPALVSARSAPLDDRLFVGGLKNLLSGVTTVCHHNPMHRSLRWGFPVRLVTRCRYSHSLLIDGQAVARECRRTPSGWPWIVHAAEGVDAEAGAEFARLDRLGCIGAKTVLVHGVGLQPEDRRALIERGGGLVWCPSSNDFLFGETADVRETARAGRAALGSDSRVSGERDLLAELKCAWATGQLDPPTLARLVTSDAAALLRLPEAGRIAPGFPADLLALPRLSDDPYETLIAANRHDVLLVTIDGRPRLGAPDFAAAFAARGVRPGRLVVDGVARLIDERLAARMRKSLAPEQGVSLEGPFP